MYMYMMHTKRYYTCSTYTYFCIYIYTIIYTYYIYTYHIIYIYTYKYGGDPGGMSRFFSKASDGLRAFPSGDEHRAHRPPGSGGTQGLQGLGW
jgi:hypothetical protein